MARRPPKPEGIEANPRFKSPRSRRDPGYTNDIRAFVDRNSNGFAFLNDNLSDADVVLTATASLDLLLQIAITSTFRGRVSNNQIQAIFSGSAAPLGSFDSKIKLCSAFAIVVDVFKDDIEIIRIIRNEFAHSLIPLSFNTDIILERCKRLRGMKNLKKNISPTSKKFFLEACVNLHLFLISSITFAAIGTQVIFDNHDKIEEAALELAYEFMTVIGVHDLL